MLAYIILAHKNIHQLRRLIDKIEKDNIVIIHIDKKINNSEFKSIQQLYVNKKNISFINKRKNCVWGDYSIIEATNMCIKKALNNSKFTHCILLSGLDFPIKSSKYINEFFLNNKNDYIECCTENKYSDKERYEMYFFKYAQKFKNLKLQNFIFRAQYKLSYFLKIKRKHPNFEKVYFGSQWWAISRSTLSKINSFLIENPNYTKFYKNTNIPDEFFYQTIVANKFNTNLKSYNLTYMIWDKDAFHPRTFTKDNLNELIKSDKLFARKFDEKIDKDILDYFSENI